MQYTCLNINETSGWWCSQTVKVCLPVVFFSVALLVECFVLLLLFFLERLIVIFVTEWLYFFSIVQGLFYFFICINLSKLNLQHLKGFKFDKMNMNPTILLMIDILSMYIAIKVFAVVKKNGLGWNVLRLTLKYCIFIVIICLIMFIVCKLLSFFDIMIVDRAMIILNDILLNTTFLNDLLLCFMIFACCFFKRHNCNRNNTTDNSKNNKNSYHFILGQLSYKRLFYITCSWCKFIK